jgi:hypothetical protein
MGHRRPRSRDSIGGRLLAERRTSNLSAIADDGWVTEDAEAHLLPHIRRWCQTPDSLLRLKDATVEDAVLEVDLEWPFCRGFGPVRGRHRYRH